MASVLDDDDSPSMKMKVDAADIKEIGLKKTKAIKKYLSDFMNGSERNVSDLLNEIQYTYPMNGELCGLLFGTEDDGTALSELTSQITYEDLERLVQQLTTLNI